MTLRAMGKQAPNAQTSAWGIINTFKTLPDVQGRTVGAIVGALVADAAVRPLHGVTAQTVQQWQRQALQQEANLQEQLDRFDPSAPIRGSGGRANFGGGGGGGASGLGTGYATTFGGERVSERHSVTSSGAESAMRGSMSPAHTSPILFAQRGDQRCEGSSALDSSSFSGQVIRAFIKGMLETKGVPLGRKNWQPLMEELSALSVKYRDEHIAASSPSSMPSTDASLGSSSSVLHAPLLPVAAVIPLLGTYPFCDDQPLRAYADPFIDLLCQVPNSPEEAHTEGSNNEKSMSGGAESTPGVEAAVRPLAHSYLSLLMRYVQVNPDPLKNAALRSAPGSSEMFPAGMSQLCPTMETPDDVNSDSAAAHHKLQVTELRRVLEILTVAQSYEEGVYQVALEGGPLCCEKAMLVGACLGAKATARFLPESWIQQVADHGTICSNAIAIGQLAWNPHQ